MNKIHSTIKIFIAMMPMLALVSCNDFLDKVPDDRTDINTIEKVQKLLISAYPTNSTVYLNEFSSDNVTDNGKSHQSQYNQEKIYRFEQDNETGNDDPRAVWSTHYSAVATANAALEQLEKINDRKNGDPLKAEALLCRAYAIFSLTNTFCMAYTDEASASKYLGIPYPKKPGESVNSRGTLAETYANISADIEAALPLLDDSYLKVAQTYQFNRRAAYAFAARFNLYYHKWQKAADYATEALGNVPLNVLRTSLANYGTGDLASFTAMKNAYCDSKEPANFLIIPRYSAYGRAQYYPYYERFAHNEEISKTETFRAGCPWGYAGYNNCYYPSRLTYGTDYQDYTSFNSEFFEITDKVNQSGYAHTVEVVFTGDETILVRAEANTLLGKLDEAVADINTWCAANCSPKYGSIVCPTFTVQNLTKYWDTVPEFAWEDGQVTVRSIKKPIHTKLQISPEQEALIQQILYMRRLETIFKGLRFQDLKRWGIEFIHPVDGEQSLVFKTNDLRGAIQLPADVIECPQPLEANPR